VRDPEGAVLGDLEPALVRAGTTRDARDATDDVAATDDLAATALHPGAATGPVLRLTEPLSLWGGTDPDGTITDPHHPQCGASLTGRVVLMTTGRGSSSSSSVLTELLRSGHGPAAFVLAEPDGILTLGALVAAELYDVQLPIACVPAETHASLPSTGELTVHCPRPTSHLDPEAGAESSASDLTLTATDRAMLAGEHGPGVALAMRLLVALARATGARQLLSVRSAHVDGCLYHGPASLDFARRLVALGASVAVPTTSNVGSVDLLHPEVVRGDPEDREAGRALMEAYVRLGCRTTFTCAPYQDPTARPARGEHVAWAESNAIAFVNSVVGARTARYGDFVDISAAITGRVPAASFHLDERRLADLVVDVTALAHGQDGTPGLLAEDAGWGVLGLVVGERVGSGVPVIVGAPAETTEDQLKAFAAGAASSGTVGLFHVVGVTPEAPTLAAVLPGRDLDTLVLQPGDLRGARDRLSPAATPPLDAVSLGTPHFSLAEFAQLAALLDDAGPAFHDDVEVYVSSSRAVLDAARAAGHLDVIEAAGATLIADTCTYVTTILGPQVRHAMTNSAKWAWYAPSNVGVSVSLGTLAECVASARTGRVVCDALRWR
jgi:predicted aconitase/predicted aconitase with swiveling domain